MQVRNETALDAYLPLDFGAPRPNGVVFLGHRKLLRGRARRIRSHDRGSGLKLLDAVDHTPPQHLIRKCITADEISGLKPTCGPS